MSEDTSKQLGRKDIDDVRRRNGDKASNRQGAAFASDASYRNQVFNGKQSTTDEYTGQRLFFARKNHGTHNTANVDHVKPIKQLIDEKQAYVDWGLLDAEDIRDYANSNPNLKVTNEALNKSKGAQSNHEVVLEKLWKQEIDPGTAERMIRSQVVSEVASGFHTGITAGTKMVEKVLPSSVHISSTDAFKTVRTTSTQMVASGIDVGISAGLMSGISNAVLVMSGQKTKEEAARDILCDTESAAVSGAAMSLIEKPALELANKTLGTTVGKIGVPQLAAAVTIGNSVVRYINGEVSGEACTAEILTNAGSLYITNALATGAMTGPVGMVVVGAAMIVTSMVGMVVDSTLGYLTKASQDEKLANARFREINRMIDEAEQVLAVQRARIQEYATQMDARYQAQVVDSFQRLLEAAVHNDYDTMTYELSCITNYYGIEPCFKNLDEFDAVFFDDDSVFKL